MTTLWWCNNCKDHGNCFWHQEKKPNGCGKNADVRELPGNRILVGRIHN